MMKFLPPRCPRRDCAAHREPVGRWFVRHGTYQPKCRRTPIPRFRCLVCHRGFSRQTFRYDFRDHAPSCNVPLLRLLTSGVGLRQSARLLVIDISAVQRKLKKMAATCALLHGNLSPHLAPGSTFLLDEEETFEQASIQPVTMPVLIEKETWFVVATDAAPIRRLAPVGTTRRWLQEESERRLGRRPDESRASVLRTLQALAHRLGGGHLVLRTDEKSSYATLVREVFRGEAKHETTSGKAARTKHNPLFPINTTLAMTRDNNGRLRRRSWLVSKRCACLQQQMCLFLVYRNYVRYRFNRDEPDDTPARLLGLLPRALQLREVLGWRQDWDRRSIHPMSSRGQRTVAEARRAVA
jgi:transposase-like protein